MRFSNAFLGLCLAATLIGCGQSQAPEAQAGPVAITSHSWPPTAPANLPVAQNPLADNYVIVFDGSGSMGSSACGTGGNARIETAKTAVRQFAKSIPASANVGLVYFGYPHGSDARIDLKLGASNRAEFDRLVAKMSASGGTPLVESMRLGLKMLTEQAQMQGGYGNYHLVVVTDGESGDGDPGPLAKRIVAETAISVHVIGFCLDGRHSLDVKGFTRYASASNPQDLERGLSAILAESESFIDSQFSVR